MCLWANPSDDALLALGLSIGMDEVAEIIFYLFFILVAWTSTLNSRFYRGYQPNGPLRPISRQNEQINPGNRHLDIMPCKQWVGVNLFLLFVEKEQTNMAAGCGPQIRIKSLLLHKYRTTRSVKPSTFASGNIFCVMIPINLRLRLRPPFNKQQRSMQPRVIRNYQRSNSCFIVLRWPYAVDRTL